MTDLLGPANATNVATSRPPETRVFPAADTFFKDCTSQTAKDGTAYQASFFNGLLQQVRRAIRGMGVTENNSDDDMLLKAIQAAGATTFATAAALQPVHVEIEQNAGAFTFTPTTGQIIVNTGLTWIWRGLTRFATTSFDVTARTFTTVAGHSYHLRWYAPGTGRATPAASYPNGRFYLEDLADTVSYNPTSAAETNSAFDSSFDSALLALVVANGGNALTVTPLVNKARLSATYVDSATTVGLGNTYPAYNAATRILVGTSDEAGKCTSRFTYNWSRTPVGVSTNVSVGISNPPADETHTQGTVNSISTQTTTRYYTEVQYFTDWDASLISGGVLQGSGYYANAHGVFDA